MNDTSDHDSDDDDDDEKDVPRAPSSRAVKNGVPAKNGVTSHKESERGKRELITMGKAKGFLTYDEVNQYMPASIVSSAQMDDWLSAFSGEGIEIVDSPSRIEVVDKGAS